MNTNNVNAIVFGDPFHNMSNALKVGGTVIIAVALTVANDSMVPNETVDPIPIVRRYSTEPMVNVGLTVPDNSGTPSEIKVDFEIADSRNVSLNLNEELMLNIKKLSEISELKSNWNGNGAAAFSGKLIEKINNLLFYLIVQPEIFPTADESIQLEFEGANDSYLEFQIDETDTAKVFCIGKDGSEKEWTISSKVASLNGVISSFYGH